MMTYKIGDYIKMIGSNDNLTKGQICEVTGFMPQFGLYTVVPIEEAHPLEAPLKGYLVSDTLFETCPNADTLFGENVLKMKSEESE